MIDNVGVWSVSVLRVVLCGRVLFPVVEDGSGCGLDVGGVGRGIGDGCVQRKT